MIYLSRDQVSQNSNETLWHDLIVQHALTGFSILILKFRINCFRRKKFLPIISGYVLWWRCPLCWTNLLPFRWDEVCVRCQRRRGNLLSSYLRNWRLPRWAELVYRAKRMAQVRLQQLKLLNDMPARQDWKLPWIQPAICVLGFPVKILRSPV